MDDTRRRLLEAAGEEFAERGFQGATVRGICQRAGLANIASINYYFGDKEKLYIEAVQHAECSQAAPPPSIPPDLPAAEKLRLFVRHMVAAMIDRDRPAWQTELMMREMARPTAACAELVRKFIGPKFQILMNIMDELLPDGAPLRDKHMCAFSVVAQCLLYRFHRPVGRMLVGEAEYETLFDVDLLTDHITRFTLLGLPRAVAARDTVGVPGASAPAEVSP